jgi:hypothetical protein
MQITISDDHIDRGIDGPRCRWCAAAIAIRESIRPVMAVEVYANVVELPNIDLRIASPGVLRRFVKAYDRWCLNECPREGRPKPLTFDLPLGRWEKEITPATTQSQTQ